MTTLENLLDLMEHTNRRIDRLAYQIAKMHNLDLELVQMRKLDLAFGIMQSETNVEAAKEKIRKLKEVAAGL